jgi:DNA repair photolyase
VKRHKKKPESGIVRSRKLEEKRLASYAVRIASGSGGSPGCATLGPNAPEHVARDARCIKGKGTLQLCEAMDAWSPQARRHDLGRLCLEAILDASSLTVRILTGRAEVQQDFDLIEQHRDRVLLGMRISGAPHQDEALRVIEPDASPIGERMAVMQEAAKRGLRTYVMLSPLLPGIGATSTALFQMLHFAEECRAEEVFAELPDPYGPELKRYSEGLATAGFQKESEAVGRIQGGAQWSRYVAQLWAMFRAHAHRFFTPDKLRFLVYPSGMDDDDLAGIWLSGEGVVWLGRSAGKRRVPFDAVERAVRRTYGPARVIVLDRPAMREGVAF